MVCPALITLLATRQADPQHWWLSDGGFPQRVAALLALRHPADGDPCSTRRVLLKAFATLAPLPEHDHGAATQLASYRYLIALHPGGASLSCWRRYPEGIGWQRRCGPMALPRFIARFNAAVADASS